MNEKIHSLLHFYKLRKSDFIIGEVGQYHIVLYITWYNKEICNSHCKIILSTKSLWCEISVQFRYIS
jgi:hypothetical protein